MTSRVPLKVTGTLRALTAQVTRFDPPSQDGGDVVGAPIVLLPNDSRGSSTNCKSGMVAVPSREAVIITD